MNEIVRRKRPAAVVYGPIVAPLGEPGRLAHRTRAGLLEAARRRVAAGEIEPIAPGAALRFEDGVWQLDVRIVPVTARELRRRRWPRVLLVLVPILALFGAGWWLAVALSAAPLATVLLLAVTVLWVLASRGGGGNAAVVISQKVDIRR